MQFFVNEIDSSLSGVRVAEVSGFAEADDVLLLEEEQLRPIGIQYVFCKVPAERTALVHSLEDAGYRFSEFQIFLRHTLKARPDVSQYPYVYVPINDVRLQDYARGLAGSIFQHDRYSHDPVFPESFSGLRYQAYFDKSMQADDERAYVMINTVTKEPVSFATRRIISDRETRLLIGGVDSRYSGSGLGVIHDLVGMAMYYDEGVRVLHTAVSGINIPIMNLEMAYFGFRVATTKVVLRKCLV